MMLLDRPPFFRLYGHEMVTKLTKLTGNDNPIVCCTRNVASEYKRLWSTTKVYRPGQRVLVRKNHKQPYIHEGTIVQRVVEFTYEVDINRKCCQYNQAHLKPKHHENSRDEGEVDLADQAYRDACSSESQLESKQANPFSDGVMNTLPIRKSSRNIVPPDRFMFKSF